MTHDELLAKLWILPADVTELQHGAKAVQALRAVVKLHKPDQYGDCAGCDNRCGCFEGDIMGCNKWETCPTIEAIEKGLG